MRAPPVWCSNQPATPRRSSARSPSSRRAARPLGGAGIQLAYNIAEDNFIKGGVNRVILATDGDFNVGIRDRDALIELIEKKRDTGITLTTLGFGTGNYNEAMMEQIANHGNGNYAYIDSALEAKKVLNEEMSSTLFTIAKDREDPGRIQPRRCQPVIGLSDTKTASCARRISTTTRLMRAISVPVTRSRRFTKIVPTGNKGWITPRRYGSGAEGAPAQGTTRACRKSRT